MLKKDLIELVASQRAEISTLRTQLAAAKAPKHFVDAYKDAQSVRTDAIKRLHALYPGAKSFTAAEVAAEIGCRSCSA